MGVGYLGNNILFIRYVLIKHFNLLYFSHYPTNYDLKIKNHINAGRYFQILE